MFVRKALILGVCIAGISTPGYSEHRHNNRPQVNQTTPEAVHRANMAGTLDYGACAGSPNLEHHKPPYTMYQRYDSICNRQNQTSSAP